MNFKTLSWAFAVLLLLATAGAIPVPLGIDGTVYELDGTTPVFDGVPVIIKDTDTGIIIKTKTGRGKKGKYSAVINGEKGDFVTVIAYTPLNKVSRNVSLDGSIHQFNLILNMSIPPMAPNITSNPTTSVLEDEDYNYKVKSFDWNNEPVTYSLEEAPEGMSITADGMVTWTPRSEDVGNHTIIVGAHDQNLTGLQKYVLEVINVNDAPVINSTPPTKATAGKLYSYEVNYYDVDDNPEMIIIDNPKGMTIRNSSIEWTPGINETGTFPVKIEVNDGKIEVEQEWEITVAANSPPEILSKPKKTAKPNKEYEYHVEGVDADKDILTYSLGQKSSGMELEGSVLKWTPTPSQVGEHGVEVKVSDGLHENSQSFTIKVTPGLGRGKGGGSGRLPPFTEEKKNKAKEKKTAPKKSEIPQDDTITGLSGASWRSYNKKPQKVPGVQRIVYKYLSIERTSEGGETKINFKVSNDWIRDRKVSKEDVVLTRYTDSWKELPTQNTGEDEKHTFYESKTPGFSYFAITIRKGKRSELPQPNVKIIEEPFILFGVVEEQFGEVPRETPIIIENSETGEIIYAETGGPSSGAYQAVLHGTKGDKVNVTVTGYYKANLEIELEESKVRLDIKAEGSGGIFGITGRFVSRITGRQVSKGIAALSFFLLLISLLFASYGVLKLTDDVSEDDSEDWRRY